MSATLRRTGLGLPLVGFAALCVVALAIPTLGPMRNHMSHGNLFYLSLWLLAVLTFAEAARHRGVRRALLALPTAAAIGLMGLAVGGAQEASARQRPVLEQDRAQLRAIARDLVSSGAPVAVVPMYSKGMPDILFYEMRKVIAQRGGRIPTLYPLPSLDPIRLENEEPYRAGAKHDIARNVDAVLLPREDAAEVEAFEGDRVRSTARPARFSTRPVAPFDSLGPIPLGPDGRACSTSGTALWSSGSASSAPGAEKWSVPEAGRIVPSPNTSRIQASRNSAPGGTS